MSVETIERGQWIFIERSLPGYFIYKLLEGKVSIHHSGSKINELEVKRGDKPVLLGMISTLRQDGYHIASVRSETELKVQRIYSDQVRGILNNEIGAEARQNLRTMIDTIVIRNEISAMNDKLKTLPAADFKVPADISDDVKEVLEGIVALYKNPEKQ